MLLPGIPPVVLPVYHFIIPSAAVLAALLIDSGSSKFKSIAEVKPVASSMLAKSPVGRMVARRLMECCPCQSGRVVGEVHAIREATSEPSITNAGSSVRAPISWHKPAPWNTRGGRRIPRTKHRVDQNTIRGGFEPFGGVLAPWLQIA